MLLEPLPALLEHLACQLGPVGGGLGGSQGGEAAEQHLARQLYPLQSLLEACLLMAKRPGRGKAGGVSSGCDKVHGEHGCRVRRAVGVGGRTAGGQGCAGGGGRGGDSSWGAGVCMGGPVWVCRGSSARRSWVGASLLRCGPALLTALALAWPGLRPVPLTPSPLPPPYPSRPHALLTAHSSALLTERLLLALAVLHVQYCAVLYHASRRWVPASQASA